MKEAYGIEPTFRLGESFIVVYRAMGLDNWKRQL